MKKTTARSRHVPPDERVSCRFSLIAKRIDQVLAAVHGKKLGISVNNWKIMRVIGFFGPISATVLGARTSLDPDKVTRAVDTLAQRSYVIRKNDETDRRRVVLSLSAKGRRVYDKIEQVAGAVEAELLSALNPEERRALLSYLRKLEQHSSAMHGRRESAFERRQFGGASRTIELRPGLRRPGKGVARKLIAAE